MASNQEQVARDLLVHVVEFLQYLQLHETITALDSERAQKRQLLSASINYTDKPKRNGVNVRAELVRYLTILRVLVMLACMHVFNGCGTAALLCLAARGTRAANAF